MRRSTLPVLIMEEWEKNTRISSRVPLSTIWQASSAVDAQPEVVLTPLLPVHERPISLQFDHEEQLPNDDPEPGMRILFIYFLPIAFLLLLLLVIFSQKCWNDTSISHWAGSTLLISVLICHCPFEGPAGSIVSAMKCNQSFFFKCSLSFAQWVHSSLFKRMRMVKVMTHSE